jgi:Tol biopolymer transport system component
MAGMSISPDEKKVAFDRTDPQTLQNDIWIHDLAGGAESRVTFGPGDSIRPVWSPDGGRIAYVNNHDGIERLYAKSVNGAPGELIDQSDFGVRVSDWSRDGRYIVERRAGPKTSFDIWALPMFGDRKPFPYLNSEAREDEGRVSPDGQWLAYDAMTTDAEVFVQTFPNPGRKWQISNGGGTRPVWARDGRAVYYIAADGVLMEVKVGAGPNPEFSKPAALFRVNAPAPNQFGVNSKGWFLVPTQIEDSLHVPLTVVVNWQADVKR